MITVDLLDKPAVEDDNKYEGTGTTPKTSRKQNQEDTRHESMAGQLDIQPNESGLGDSGKFILMFLYT